MNLAVLNRHSLKYKNIVSQKTFYRDAKLQMSSKISKGGKEARLKEGGGGRKGEQKDGLTDVSCRLQTPRHYGTFPWASRKGRPETMPAHTQTRRAEDKHTDRQTSADNTVLGFRAPWIFLPSGTRFTLLNGVHCSPDAGSGALLPAEPAAFQRARWPQSCAGWNIQSVPNLYRKLSPVPDTSLLRASDLHWTFLSCLSTRAIICPSPLSWKCSLPPVKGSRASPQMLCPMSKSPSGKIEGFQDSATRKKGNLLLTRVRAPAASNAVVRGQRAPSPRCYINL